MFVRQQVYSFSEINTIPGYMARGSVVTNEAIAKNQKQRLIFSIFNGRIYFIKTKKVQSQEVFLGFFSVLEMLYLEVVHCSAPGISSLYIGITGDFLDSWKMEEYLRLKTVICY